MIKKYFHMKQLFIFGVIVFFLVACEQKPKSPMDEYGDAMINTYERAQKLADQANLKAIKNAIQLYKVENDKYPERLEDIEYLMGTKLDFSKYDYDPQTGAVSIKSK